MNGTTCAHINLCRQHHIWGMGKEIKFQHIRIGGPDTNIDTPPRPPFQRPCINMAYQGWLKMHGKLCLLDDTLVLNKLDLTLQYHLPHATPCWILPIPSNWSRKITFILHRNQSPKLFLPHSIRNTPPPGNNGRYSSYGFKSFKAFREYHASFPFSGYFPSRSTKVSLRKNTNQSRINPRRST